MPGRSAGPTERPGSTRRRVGLVEGHGLGVPASDRAELRALRAVFPPPSAGAPRALGAVSSHDRPRDARRRHGRADQDGPGAAPPGPAADAARRRPAPAAGRATALAAARPRPGPGSTATSTTPDGPGSTRSASPGSTPTPCSRSMPPRPTAMTAGCHARTGRPRRSSWRPPTAATWPTACGRSSTGSRGEARRVAQGPGLHAQHVRAGPEGPARLGLVVESPDDLREHLRGRSSPKLGDPACRSIRDARGIYFWDEPLGRAGTLAFLFPGEGSQYPGMLADLCPHFPEVRAVFDTADRVARESGERACRRAEHLFGGPRGRIGRSGRPRPPSTPCSRRSGRCTSC